jgi:hypothetical protein
LWNSAHHRAISPWCHVPTADRQASTGVSHLQEELLLGLEQRIEHVHGVGVPFRLSLRYRRGTLRGTGSTS